MPKMQEHFSAVPQWRGILKQNAENAGAFSGGCLDRTTSLNRNHFGWPDMPKMQEPHDILKTQSFWKDR